MMRPFILRSEIHGCAQVEDELWHARRIVAIVLAACGAFQFRIEEGRAHHQAQAAKYFAVRRQFEAAHPRGAVVAVNVG